MLLSRENSTAIAVGWGEGSRACVPNTEEGKRWGEKWKDWLCFTDYVENKSQV